MFFIIDLVVLVVLFVIVVQVVRLIFADADLTLLLYESFGKRVDSLSGKVVWITGCSSGIGRALALALARVHCLLVLTARREDELTKLKDECLAFGLADQDVLVLPMDITDLSKHKDAVRDVMLHFGKVDVLVNNAGRSQRAIFEKVDMQVDKDLFDLNVFAQISLTTELMPHFMERKRGHFAFTSSLAGKMGVPCSRAYTASKHALHGYAECLRVERGRSHNIDVTMLCPGPVVSEILKNAFTDVPGESFGGEIQLSSIKMSAERCAHLSAVAIANRLDEVWISRQPVLILYYAAQYFPSITRWVLKKVGPHMMMSMRDSQQTVTDSQE